ncbi:MAG: hypothetical protein J6T10_29030, partial [Methanobrevibacter sp.]|nr:hypothetical protein [Methanobrevibacter sp.]
MIVRGIVESTFKNQAKVRIPIFDKVFSASLCVDYSGLSDATICVPPKFDMNVKNGDTVYILFEDNNRQKPIIIGFIKNDKNGYCESESISVVFENSVVLPEDAVIGNVNQNNIKNLYGLDKNVQNFINEINENVNNKVNNINNISNNISNININNINNNITNVNNNLEILKSLIGKENDTAMDNTLFGQLNFASNYLDETLLKIGNVDFSKRFTDVVDDYLEKIKLLEESMKNRLIFE